MRTCYAKQFQLHQVRTSKEAVISNVATIRLGFGDCRGISLPVESRGGKEMDGWLNKWWQMWGQQGKATVEEIHLVGTARVGATTSRWCYNKNHVMRWWLISASPMAGSLPEEEVQSGTEATMGAKGGLSASYQLEYHEAPAPKSLLRNRGRRKRKWRKKKERRAPPRVQP